VQELAHAFSLVVRHDWLGMPYERRPGLYHHGATSWESDVRALVQQGHLSAELLNWSWAPLQLTDSGRHALRTMLVLFDIGSPLHPDTDPGGTLLVLYFLRLHQPHKQPLPSAQQLWQQQDLRCWVRCYRSSLKYGLPQTFFERLQLSLAGKCGPTKAQPAFSESQMHLRLSNSKLQLVLERTPSNMRCFLLRLHAPAASSKEVADEVAAAAVVVMKHAVECVAEVERGFKGEQLESWVPCPAGLHAGACCYFAPDELELDTLTRDSVVHCHEHSDATPLEPQVCVQCCVGCHVMMHIIEVAAVASCDVCCAAHLSHTGCLSGGRCMAASFGAASAQRQSAPPQDHRCAPGLHGPRGWAQPTCAVCGGGEVIAASYGFGGY
jgi:hypothetical protein